LQHISKRSWGPEQACGPPDSFGAGDLVTAWAPKTADGQLEWLLVEYERAVEATDVQIHETYHPGAVMRVTALAPNGTETLLWAGRAPTPAPRRELEVPLSPPLLIQRVKLYLDSPAVAGWNEIDAVGLRDSAGSMQWAVRAEASSSYADRGPLGDLDRLVPAWSGFRKTNRDFATGGDINETRFAAGFGWPLPAMYVRGSVPSGGISALPFPPPFPIWGGLMLDALTYVLLLWLLWMMLSRPVRVTREILRMRRGVCPKCGYDLRFDFAHGCPECGLLRAARS
jgi:hypothetical protein